MSTRSKRTSSIQSNGRRAAIGYVRVSTLGQAVEGVSLEAQREAITRQAAAAGFELLVIESDEGISGKRSDTRPGLQRAIAAACEHRAALFVYSLSRLARNTRETLAFADQLERSGADLVSLSEKIDTSGACGKMVFRMLAVLAEFERDVISERTRFAMAGKRLRREKTGGSVPFGFVSELVDSRWMLLPNIEEQRTIEMMLDLHQAGRSLREIGSTLEDQGRKPRSGGRWHAKVLASIIERELGKRELTTT
jgi:site-specific DNA recombinase